MQERRNDARLLCADLIELIWNDHSGQEQRRVGNLEDISSSGMSLQLEMPVRVGTPIRMRCGEKELTGTVRHAEHRENAYFIGVEFEKNNRWSARDFVPQHLFDPRQILRRPAGQRPASKWVN
jgi:hypothetical protein